ncbi:MAG: SAM-dependent methyltransferase, partial [Candidatus Acidiferrales bacterium]
MILSLPLVPHASTQTQTPLAQLLAARIREVGLITFAEYMAECLYHPDFGYYSRPVSRRLADYYTSVDLHPIFGRLLARQLAEMWEALGRPSRFDAVECGAGTGRLAAHILDFTARALPEFYAALHYTTVEASAARRAFLETTLAAYRAAGRAESARDLPSRIAAGCVFSNELLDALPVHRVICSGGKLREVCVGLDGERFTDVMAPLSTSAIAEYFAMQRVTLAEGQQAEAGLAAAEWMEAA